jgi:hypothetical protein
VLGGAGPLGGNVTLTAGQGDTTDGGAASLTAGSGAVDGGVATLVGGAGAAVGGPSSVQGGAGGTGNGGAAGVLGGNSTGGGNGGSAVVDAGTGAINGNALVGTVRAEAVSVGRSGKDVKTYGRNVEMTDSRAAVAATTLPVNAPTILLTNAGAIDLNGGNPEVQTSSITTGTRVTIIQTGAGTTTFRDSSDDATSALQLSAASHVLGQYDALTLVFTGTVWVEVAFVNN